MKKSGPLLIFFLVIITGGLYLSSKSGIEVLEDNYFLSLSQILALVGTMLLSITYILTTRNYWIERLFGGLDRVYKAHAITSGLAFLLLLYHPLLLVIKALPNFNLALLYIVPSSNLAYTAGIMALLFMIILLMVTIYINLPYELWKKSHEYMGVVALAGLIHVFLIDSDVSRSLPLRYWMISWICIGITSFIYKRFLYKSLGSSADYLVNKIGRWGDVLEISLTPVNKPLYYQAGQFGFLAVKDNPNITNEEHPYSFVSHPSEKEIRLGIKITGDHTLSLKRLEVGQKVTIGGPYGCFGERIYTRNPVVLIAGGIGITPILSVAKEASLKRSAPTYVFYVSKNQSEAVFEEELKKLENIKLFSHYSAETGRFCIEHLTTNVPDLKSAVVLICGPMEMINNVSNQLYDYGLKKKQVVFEDFNLK